MSNPSSQNASILAPSVWNFFLESEITFESSYVHMEISA